ncbi:MAG: enoyl-CoA hydratase/isomerase family protein [Rubrivivax sp.]|nr:enoyl-CoA hydratase/isomerase family protein [Rubrivivax sp.]
MAGTSHPLSCDELGISLDGAVATLTMNRPQVLNAFDRAQRRRFDAALRALDADDAVRVLVLTGHGRAFCAGQDQHESAAMDAAASAQRIDDYMSLYRTLRALRKPMIALVNGVAAGAGLQIALLCDLRIGTPVARIGMTELKIGSVAVTGSFLLHAHVGEAVMRRLVLLAEVIDARQSLELGLLHEVHADDAIAARMAELCAQLATLAPGPLALTKQWWAAMSDERFEAAAAAAKAAHGANFASGTYSAGARRFTRGESR